MYEKKHLRQDKKRTYYQKNSYLKNEKKGNKNY